MSRTTGGGELRTVDDLDTVVEADGHVTAPAPMLLPYMDAEFDDVRQFYERSPNGSLEFSAASVASPLYLYERMKEREGKEGFSFGRPSDAGDLLEVMEEHGIDRAIANNLGFSPRRNPRHAAGLVNAYNNWVREEFDDYPNIYANMLGTPLDPEFTEYAERVVANAKTLAEVFRSAGITPVSGGTDKHLLLLDLRDSHPDLTGEDAEDALDDVGITVNKNTVPGETRSPFVTSGIRVGTPALTTRGFDEAAMETVGELIVERLNHPDDPDVASEVRDEVDRLCAEFPVYE